ncbi:MAG: OmpL47-type beta-barrel domain-containing protein, partial [Aggregatilineaceae bacterium]
RLLLLFVILTASLWAAIPALADYLGPDRTRTESHVETYDWGVWAKPDPTGNSCNHAYGPDCIVCTWKRKPGKPCGDATYWYKVGTRSEVVEHTVTYPEATISGTLNNCNARNGWCSTAPLLSLSASEPVAGYTITLIEGTRNGETFACNGSSCELPLLEGENAFTFWALSSWGDSSRMGTLTAKVDTRPPQVDGSLSGTAGEAGWYISPVTFSASASDPEPGSGLEAFSYSLDGGPWTAYSAPITVSDGVHTVTFRAQDLAGHVGEASASVQVDTLPPQVNTSLSGDQLNGWYLSQVTFTASASDSGSGVEQMEYALDGSSWQPYNAPVTVGDGVHTLRVRAFDAAGNQAEAAPLNFQVDGTPPRIRLTSSWYIWESGELKVGDGQSGLSSVEIEIRDPQGRWRKVSRAYETDGQPFSTDIAWDRRFADGTLAPIGTYQVVVKAFDRAGNAAQESASIYIPAPNAPTYTPAPTRTALPSPTHLPSLTPAASPLAPATIAPTRTPLVSAFGAFPTPILDRQSARPQPANSQSAVLWGAAALTAIGAATAYALE